MNPANIRRETSSIPSDSNNLRAIFFFFFFSNFIVIRIIENRARRLNFFPSIRPRRKHRTIKIEETAWKRWPSVNRSLCQRTFEIFMRRFKRGSLFDRDGASWPERKLGETRVYTLWKRERKEGRKGSEKREESLRSNTRNWQRGRLSNH